VKNFCFFMNPQMLSLEEHLTLMKSWIKLPHLYRSSEFFWRKYTFISRAYWMETFFEVILQILII
jgi:hypothetical protein